MKILLYGDIHWSATSSLVTQRGNKYTKRLELLIDTMNWLQQLSMQYKCGAQICLGDFCDKSVLKDEEISALSEISWSNVPAYFIVGNHESAQHALTFSTVDVLKQAVSTINVFSNSTKVNLDNTTFYFIPYIVESDREALSEVLKAADISNPDIPTLANRVIISHNDIAGQNYGGFISKLGFSIDEIMEQHCLFLNGHLHNTTYVTDRILNVGSTTAHNFTNDSNVYKYGAWLFDTNSKSLTFIENPHSLHFYKFDFETADSVATIAKLPSNSIVSIRCTQNSYSAVQQLLENNVNNIIANRVVTIRLNKTEDLVTESIQDLRHNHLEKLVEFCTGELPNTEILQAELAEICK